jgi:protein-tyrosine phosphatase
MGNICRSPAAEGIFKRFVKNANLDQKIEVDSAGTIDYHEGELPDARMIKHAGRRGYILDSHARQFNPKKDFDRFDYIITMDDDNYADIVRNDYNKIYRNKIFKMTDFSSDNSVKGVPDPYYGGANGFENVIDILEDSTANLLNKIRADIERLDPK